MSNIANANFATAITNKGSDAFFVGVLFGSESLHNAGEIARLLGGNASRDFLAGVAAAKEGGETHGPSILSAMQAVYK
jgi:hypothetical protein